MATIFQNYDNTKQAFINPQDTTKPVPDFPEYCVTTFSKDIIEKFAAVDGVKIIANLYTANGAIPIYEINYRGFRIALFLSLVGAPACIACLEEVIASGAEKIVMFGCAGILDDSAVQGKLMIPSSAVRDEGTSYHYLPPSEEIDADIRFVEVLERCFEQKGIPYVTGKTWTTDAIYRETPKRIGERKKQGCLTVEMECSAALAVTQFRQIPFAQFLYGADSLSGESWEPNDLTDYGLKGADKYMTLAFECVIKL